MDYPVWFLPGIGGGFFIALIAIVHVFVSHFAVGGGLYLVWTERKGLRENNLRILEFTRRHTGFFMLLTMVFGGITGVGIWFIISLVNPAATSKLIHLFVYGWAAEWVWFLVEIIALLVYYYTFGRMDSTRHQIVGWIYAAAAWLSLFLINGIIDFMLTPGQWLENGRFWSGFFNPTFWPALFFRSFFAFMLAGLYGFVNSVRIADAETRRTMARYNGKWSLGFLALLLPSAWWYLQALPQPARELVLGASPTIRAAIPWAIAGLAGVISLTVLLTLARPTSKSLPLALATLIPAFFMMGSFEWTREAARRPFVINQYMYSTGVTLARAEALKGQSYLANTRFASVRQVKDDNLSVAGAELFKFQCYACHTIGGLNNDILQRTSAMDYKGMVNYLLKVMHKRPYMPPFLGTEKEAQALAAYLIGDLQGKPVDLASLETTTSPGQELYEENCVGCHGLDIIRDWTRGQSVDEVVVGLGSLSELNESMENFAGSIEQKRQLALFLKGGGAGGLQAKAVLEENCTGCHGLETIREWSSSLSKKKILEGIGRLGALNPMMEGISLEPDQLQSVAEWLKTSAKGGAK